MAVRTSKTSEKAQPLEKTQTPQSAPTSQGAQTPPIQKPGAGRLPARERLLAAANELFYEEGVHTVGIDRVIEHAGVAKATLYSAFGSKDELIRAYLLGRHQVRRERTTRVLERFEAPRDRLLAVFDALGESLADPGYRGCAFVKASAEARPGSAIEQAVDTYRTWLRELFVRLAREAGARDPERLAKQLHMLYDGAGVAASMDHDREAAAEAREAAEGLIDAAIAAGTR